MFRFLFLFSCLFYLGCNVTPDDTKESPLSQPTETVTADRLTAKQTISVYDHPQGKQIAQIKAGQSLLLTPSISDKLYTHFTEKDTLCLPYLQIQLSQHTSGWVLAKSSHYEGLDIDWQHRQCMRAVLNERNYNNYLHLKNTWEETKTAPLLLLALETEHQLVSDLTNTFRAFPFLSINAFENLLPATITYRDNESINWWIDYNQWMERSLLTAEQYDDALIGFYQQKIYPPDGISYGFPAWTFPVSKKEDHSLLGRGIHLSYLKELHELSVKYAQIDYKWNNIIKIIIDDALKPNRSFWEELSAIEQEIDEILKLKMPLIQQEYKEELHKLMLRLRSSDSDLVGFRAK